MTAMSSKTKDRNRARANRRKRKLLAKYRPQRARAAT